MGSLHLALFNITKASVRQGKTARAWPRKQRKEAAGGVPFSAQTEKLRRKQKNFGANIITHTNRGTKKGEESCVHDDNDVLCVWWWWWMCGAREQHTAEVSLFLSPSLCEWFRFRRSFFVCAEVFSFAPRMALLPKERPYMSFVVRYEFLFFPPFRVEKGG